MKTGGMDKGKVIELLEYYKEIDGEIGIYRRIVSEYEDRFYNTIGAMAGDGMPKGKNHITRPVENAAIHIPDNVRGDIAEYERKIHTLQILKSQMLQEVSRLRLKEKSIIFDYYIHGLKWEQVAERLHYSDRQCKNIRDAAVEKLIVRFDNNPNIKGFCK